MPREIIRPNPMYMQVADRLAQEITAGDYAPGSVLPSETQMMERFGIGRATVRAAIAELRSMGLAESQHGKGTLVKSAPTPAVTVPRTITRTGKRHTVPELAQKEPPAVSRTTITGTVAELLDRDAADEDDAFSVDRLLTDTTTGVRMAHRTVIPLSVAADAPQLAETPDAPLGELYDHLSAAGHDLTWNEYVTARTPFPDERTALGLPDASPLLVTYRVTYGTDNRPLICEELRAPAATARLAYRISPDKAPAKRPTRQTKAESSPR